MPQVPLTLPNLPDAEALKTGRPASSGAALPLVQAPGYTLGLRALRTHTQHYTLDDWELDLVPISAEVRRVLYRPSPFAQRLFVFAWVGTDWRGRSSAPAKVEVQLAILENAGLTLVASAPTRNLGRPRRPGYPGDWVPAPVFTVEDSNLNSGTEQLVAMFEPIDITGLNGLDGWVEVTTEGASVLSVTWVELVEEVLP